MWIVVGLGNPGDRYTDDRHNIGFRVVDALLQQAEGSWQTSRFQSLLAKVHCGTADQHALLVQPQTYMNLSGEAVSPLCHFYHTEPSHVLIVHDELELPFGRIQLKRGGGESGHRGLLSISDSLGSRNYLRLRFGIGRPPTSDVQIADYVLSSFSEQEEVELPDLIEHAVAAIRCCCVEGENKAMNRFNSRRQKQASHSPS